MEEKKYVDFDKVIITYKTFGHLNLHNALEAFNEIPAADVRPVVTCDVCVWHVDDGNHYCKKWRKLCPDNADFFCAYGERPNCGADMRGINE